ncbi:MAG: tRNA (N(6)-L-threonylcarbamoyladenosine(37)-C(2))-methylthiotransferase MtaB [Rickettsiaceae bacterium]
MIENLVKTFGCRLNIYESEIIKQNLHNAQLDNTIVFNTCAVTKQAEKDAVKAIRKAKRDNPDSKILVTGCAAQSSPEIFAAMPEVDKVIGNEEKLHSEYYNFDTDRVIVNDIMSVKESSYHLLQDFEFKSRAFIQVQNGCDHRCTFCNIPYARGNNRSVPIGVIAKQLNILTQTGYNEVVFTGVDVTAYGADLPGNPTLAQMIKRILSQVPNLSRLRLSSIDVAEIDDELFELMAYETRLMPHFHISLQSGDNMILKRMKRRHNRENVIEFCRKLRSIRPEVAFGADIIAGFPTETEAMFENTKHLIAQADLQYLHIFPYSARDGTPASRMPQLPNDEVKMRAKILRDTGQEQLLQFFNNNINNRVELLVENNQIAHSENFIPVKFSESMKVGSLIKAQLTGIQGANMTANIITA